MVENDSFFSATSYNYWKRLSFLKRFVLTNNNGSLRIYSERGKRKGKDSDGIGKWGEVL